MRRVVGTLAGPRYGLSADLFCCPLNNYLHVGADGTTNGSRLSLHVVNRRHHLHGVEGRN